jgi:hypothetical protein
MSCSSGCVTKDHDSFGACLRAKRLQIDRFSLRSDGATERRSNAALNDYAELRKHGSQPASPWPKDVEHAKKEAMKDGVYVADC